MAFIFVRQDKAAFKVPYLGASDNVNITLQGVSGSITDANVIVRGVQCLLNIGGLADKYDVSRAERTVKEDVEYDS